MEYLQQLPPPRAKSLADDEAVIPFLAGKGGGVSEDSSCTELPFLRGSRGGMSKYSGSLLSVESEENKTTTR